MVVNFINGKIYSAKELRNIAQNVERIIEREFPEAISTTRFEALAKTPEHKQRFKLISEYFARYIRKEYNNGGETPLEHYKGLVEMIKKRRAVKYTEGSPVVHYNIANCAEYARLGNLILGLNGFEAKICTIFNEVKGIDHAITVIFPDKQKSFFLERLNKLKDTVIVDPWLKFSGRAQDYAETCVKDHTKLFFEKTEPIPNPNNICVGNKFPRIVPVTKDVIDYFKVHFPQFFIKNLT